MQKHAQLNGSSKFHAVLFALKEKQNIREIVLEKSLVAVNMELSKQEKLKRFWVTDFPLLCYTDYEIENSQLASFSLDKEMKMPK